MNKLLLFCVGLMFSSLASFGQDSFNLPQVSSVFGTTPAFLGGAIFNLEKVGTTIDGEDEPIVIEGYRQISSFRSGVTHLPGEVEINYSEGSNMPIIDLSRGYFSNFPIKLFPKNFPSKMPITELRLPNLIILPQK